MDSDFSYFFTIDHSDIKVKSILLQVIPRTLPPHNALFLVLDLPSLHFHSCSVTIQRNSYSSWEKLCV